MTLTLVIFVFMVIAGAALLGWLLRWNLAGGSELTDPREVLRSKATADTDGAVR